MKTGNPAACDVVLEQLLTAFDRLAEMPRMGRPRPEFGRGLRSHQVGRHTVFYRPHRTHVEITRVIHQGRDLRRAFARSKRSKLELTPEFEEGVWERIESGRYASTADVLTACLEALEAREADEDQIEWLRREIKIGSDQIERGEFVDGKEAFARLRQRIIERAAEQARQAEAEADKPDDSHER